MSFNTPINHKILEKNNGFTLSEIMVTIVIIGVLASLALPRFGGTFERAKSAEGVQILTAVLGSQAAYKLETGDYATVFANLDVTFANSANFTLPPTVLDPADPVANPIATITRNGGYQLGINERGTITCTDIAGITCARAGY